MFGVARSWDTATLTGSRVTHGRVHETVAESGGCRPDHVAPSLRTVTLCTDWPERASWALVASRQVPLPLSLSLNVFVCLSLSHRQTAKLLKKHQEHSLEVRDFHQVALAAFQTVPIHPAAEPAWAHGAQTILSPDFCPCSIPRPLNQHNGSAALSRASGARGGECADELRGRVGGAGMPESPPVTCPGLGPPGILKRAAQRPRDARNR